MSRRALLAAIRAHGIETPTAIAAADGDACLDRAGLDRASAALAAAIEQAMRDAIGHAIGPARSPAIVRASDRSGGQVGLLAGHRAIALVGVLGVLESGRCLVPLNGHESDDLLAALVRDAAVAVLLADRAHAARARAIRPGRAVHQKEAPRD